MTTTPEALTSSYDDNDLVLRLMAAAYLGRYTGISRLHTESDLRLFFAWYTDQNLAPLTAQRAQIERYVRWMQEIRTGNVGRVEFTDSAPGKPAREHAWSGWGEARLGLRIFEACAADIQDLGEEHGHRVLRVCGKGAKIVLVPLPPAVGRALDGATADRMSGPILLNRRGVRMDRHCATRRLRRLAEMSVVRLPRMHPHMLRHILSTSYAGVDLRDVQIAARHADPRTTMRYDRARKNLDRHPNYILAAYMASGT